MQQKLAEPNNLLLLWVVLLMLLFLFEQVCTLICLYLYLHLCSFFFFSSLFDHPCCRLFFFCLPFLHSLLHRGSFSLFSSSFSPQKLTIKQTNKQTKKQKNKKKTKKKKTGFNDVLSPSPIQPPLPSIFSFFCTPLHLIELTIYSSLFLSLPHRYLS